MKKSMCITYVVEKNLYVNITNKCSNNCDFCIRNNGDGAYGSDSLWLEREPTVGEILDSVFSNDLTQYEEVVFCGYGEPTYRFDDAIIVAKEIKKRAPGTKTRINTNGQSDIILKRKTAKDYQGAFDTVSISLNAPTAEGYDKICHSRFGTSAFYAMIEFAKEVSSFVPRVVFSVVRDFLDEGELGACEDIAASCGVSLNVRDYIPPRSE